MTNIYVIIFMAVTSAWSGGSLWPSQYLHKKLTWLPEAFFALPFGLVWFPVLAAFDIDLYQSLVVKGYHYAVVAVPFEYVGSALIAAWSYIWMQTSTGPALHWGGNPEDGMSRPRTLSPVVNFISDKLGFQRGDVNYCRTWMATKGFLLTLPVGAAGILLWPLGYELGHRLGSNTYRELLAGAGAGIAIALFLYFFFLFRQVVQ